MDKIQTNYIEFKKPSKYKRVNTWADSSGDITDEEIALVFYFDEIDSKAEEQEKRKLIIN